MAVMKSEFFLALNQVATERGISPDDVLDSIKSAVLAAYHKDYGPQIETSQETIDDRTEENPEGVEVKINQESGEMHIFKDDADITPPGFGRIAAQTARQVILQQIREAEKRTIVQHYSAQVGSIIKGRIIRFEGRNVIIDIGKAEAFLPVEEQIRSEGYHLSDTLTVYIKEIKEDQYNNSRIIVSRADNELVKQLFQKEVPEIDSGTVVIKGVVREPGERTKISVHSDQTGVDPVGACVGQKGMRVKAVTEELGGAEKIDIIQYNSDDVIYIREALSPAKILSVDLDKKEKRAIVHVDVDQAPLAIGQRGVNVNLAGALTGYTLDVVQKQGEKVVEEEAEVEEDTPAVEEPTDAPVEETPTEEVAETPVDEISEPEETPEPAEEAETPEPAEETPSENSEEAAA
jgi:N utilization substance protein A